MSLCVRLLSVFLLIGFCSVSQGAAPPLAGKEYTVVKPPQPTDSPGKVEVLEFFWYGCPHCYNLQGPLHEWLKRKPADVEFRRVPAVFQESWVPLTRAYYAEEALGVVDKLHAQIFRAVHDEKVRLNDPKVLFDWVATKGVDKQKFMDAYNSFAVEGRTQRSIDLTRTFDIPGTPAVVIDGKFVTAPSMTLRGDKSIDYARFFEVVDQLIAQSRKQPAGKK